MNRLDEMLQNREGMEQDSLPEKLRRATYPGDKPSTIGQKTKAIIVNKKLKNALERTNDELTRSKEAITDLESRLLVREAQANKYMTTITELQSDKESLTTKLKESKAFYKCNMLEQINQFQQRERELQEKNDDLQQQLETRDDTIKQIGRELVEKEAFIRRKKSDEEMALIMGKIPVSTQTLSLEGWTSTAPDIGSTSTASQIGATALDPDVKATACQLGVTALEPERKISPCSKVKATPVTSNIKASAPDGKSSTTDFQVKATSLAPDMRETTTASLIGTSLAPDTRKTDETAPLGRATEQNVSILQESGVNDTISLTNEPTTAIERSVFNHYKLLLLMITHRLLLSDVVKFKEWARIEFQINDLHNVWDILLKLDERKIITAMNLEKLREFFLGIVRFDLVHLIDCFKIGDYTYLNDASLTGAPRNRVVTSPRVVNEPRPREGRTRASDSTQGAPAVRTTAVSADGTQQTARMLTVRAPTVAIECGQDEQGASADTQVPQGDVDSNSRTAYLHFQRRVGNDNNRWPCSHYKRRCGVKFSCCNEYWPCHRCHNHKSKCGQMKLKSRDTKFVKCEKCRKEQPFTERSQYCTNCNMKFAKYFCAICKHLTGTDENPYHCEQCGICRIHRDRSFHCDDCGVCLDVQFRENHDCRARSAHDNCCICGEVLLADHRTLPCSHKIHTECMNPVSIAGCPICLDLTDASPVEETEDPE